MEEIWKDVIGREGVYQVSNLGRVKSLARQVIKKNGVWNVYEKILTIRINESGYAQVNLRYHRQRTRKVHQIVAEAFLDHIPCGMTLVVNHINFIKNDNRVDNLEIVTHRENTNKKHLKSSSQYTGVSRVKSRGCWSAQININGKKKFLGHFTNEIQASNAYQNKLKQITT